jgi:hypothetical protein
MPPRRPTRVADAVPASEKMISESGDVTVAVIGGIPGEAAQSRLVGCQEVYGADAPPESYGL